MPARVISAHTLSKALGCHGGVIAGDAALIGKLRVDSPAFVAHSPSPLPVAAAAAVALRFSSGVSRSGGPGLGQRGLRPCRAACARVGPCRHPRADHLPGRTAGLELGRIQAELFARDICVAHVTRYSSTPAGGAVLRIAIFATHTEAQIDRLVAEVGRLL